MIASQLRNLLGDLRSHGWRPTASRVVGKVRRLVYAGESLELLEAPTSVGDATTPPETGAQSLSFEELEAHEVENAVRLPEVLKRRYREGDTCWGIFHSGDLVHVAWSSAGRLPIDRGAAVEMDARTVGIYDMYTWPQYRGQGFQGFALRWICAHAAERGFARAVAVVHPQNRPSLAAFSRAGFQVAGKVRRRTILGMEVLRATWLGDRDAARQ